MAMQLMTRADFYAELESRGCELLNKVYFGSFWRAPDGRTFQVALPDLDTDSYPDWMLDDLIERHDLPVAPFLRDQPNGSS